MAFESPQDAEDAFYDALEGADLEAMASVWDSSDQIACLLPMTPLLRGPAVMEMWRSMLGSGTGVDIQIRHLAWIEGGDLALHLVEERIGAGPDGRPAPPPLYASKLYRRGPEGWRLVVHQSSPTPPPPGSMPRQGQRPQA
jgi:ketosteroid isomerase-like protein